MKWPGILTACMGVMVVVSTLSGSVAAADLPAGRQLPIKELRERTSALIGRDLILSGVVEAVEPITEENFDDWRLVSPCIGSYFVTLKDDTGFVDVLVRGNCLLKPPMVNGLWIVKGEKVWVKVTIFVPNLNPFALNPLVRAIAKDFGVLPSE